MYVKVYTHSEEGYTKLLIIVSLLVQDWKGKSPDDQLFIHFGIAGVLN